MSGVWRAGDELSCATDSAVRQEHVRDAIRWSWKGYRHAPWDEGPTFPLCTSKRPANELRPISCLTFFLD